MWTSLDLFGVAIELSTVMAFDIGVYLVVVGALSAPSRWRSKTRDDG